MTDERPDALLPAGKLPPDLLGRLIRSHAPQDPSVLIGPGVGRDAAAIALDGTTLVVKTDPVTFATDSVPRYLVNVNANDLACLGATPRWLLVTALLPEGGTTVASVEAQFHELGEACREHGISLVGGHTEITPGVPRPLLVGLLLGTVAAGRLLKPGGGRVGDQLLLTKAIAIEGTALLARERREALAAALGEAIVRRAAHLLIDPGISVVRDATILLDAGGVTALHDPTEGGLAMGLRELAGVAGCGAEIDADLIPILPETRAIAGHFGIDPLGMLASGSLLAAVDPAAVGRVEAACARAGIPVSRIGALLPTEQGFGLRVGGAAQPLPAFARDEVSVALAEVELTRV